MSNFKINGFCDWHTECDRCGKSELKGTYNITTGSGESFFLGSSCIKKAYQMTQKEFSKKVASDEAIRRNDAKKELKSTIEYKNYIGQYDNTNGASKFEKDYDENGREYAMRFVLPYNNKRKEIAKKYNVNYIFI